MSVRSDQRSLWVRTGRATGGVKSSKFKKTLTILHFMTTTTLEEDMARLAQIEAAMIEFAAEELEELEPGRIVREEVERKRSEMTDFPNGARLRQTSPADKKPARGREQPEGNSEAESNRRNRHEIAHEAAAPRIGARRRGGYRVPEGEAGLRWWDV